ncbi:MAG: hypothetical protein ACU0BB_10120 [Paracoccaceae bacterium]
MSGYKLSFDPETYYAIVDDQFSASASDVLQNSSRRIGSSLGSNTANIAEQLAMRDSIRKYADEYNDALDNYNANATAENQAILEA